MQTNRFSSTVVNASPNLPNRPSIWILGCMASVQAISLPASADEGEVAAESPWSQGPLTGQGPFHAIDGSSIPDSGTFTVATEAGWGRQDVGDPGSSDQVLGRVAVAASVGMMELGAVLPMRLMGSAPDSNSMAAGDPAFDLKLRVVEGRARAPGLAVITGAVVKGGGATRFAEPGQLGWFSSISGDLAVGRFTFASEIGLQLVPPGVATGVWAGSHARGALGLAGDLGQGVGLSLEAEAGLPFEPDDGLALAGNLGLHHGLDRAGRLQVVYSAGAGTVAAAAPVLPNLGVTFRWHGGTAPSHSLADEGAELPCTGVARAPASGSPVPSCHGLRLASVSVVNAEGDPIRLASWRHEDEHGASGEWLVIGERDTVYTVDAPGYLPSRQILQASLKNGSEVRWVLTPEPATLQVQVVDEQNSVVPGARWLVDGSESGAERSGARISHEAGSLWLVVSASGYRPTRREVQLHAGSEHYLTVTMIPAAVELVGDHLSPEVSLTFQGDGLQLTSAAEAQLGDVAAILGTNLNLPNARVDGYANSEEAAVTPQLAWRRAGVVYDWLVAHGVDSDRIEPMGWARQPACGAGSGTPAVGSAVQISAPLGAYGSVRPILPCNPLTASERASTLQGASTDRGLALTVPTLR